MKTFAVGEAVHSVTVQQRTAGVDASGAPQETWTTLYDAAKMSRVNGRTERGSETWKADQLSAAVITRWTMRYSAAMDPDLVDVMADRRLVYQHRVYDIIAADVLDRKNGITLRTLAASKVPS